MSNELPRCFSCGKELQLPDGPIGRGASCSHCSSDVRVCYNCKHYDAKAYNECQEVQAERVVEKGRANFCDYFSLAGSYRQKSTEKDEIFKNLDALFKK